MDVQYAKNRQKLGHLLLAVKSSVLPAPALYNVTDCMHQVLRSTKSFVFFQPGAIGLDEILMETISSAAFNGHSDGGSINTTAASTDFSQELTLSSSAFINSSINSQSPHYSNVEVVTSQTLDYVLPADDPSSPGNS